MDIKKITVASLSASEHFQKYCLEPDPIDTEYWEKWIAEHEEHRETFEEARRLVKSFAFHLPEEEVNLELQQLRQQISKSKSVPQRRFSRRLLLRVAASFLLIVATVWLWNHWQPQPLLEQTTAFGATQSVTLPDGSSVMLNANSRLRYAPSWGEKEERVVWLEGEAYFDVVHQPQRPFAVHTEKGTVQVLGTSFNLLQRTDELQVTLVEGKVRLALSNKTEINLQPGEQVMVSNNTVDHRKSGVNIDLITSWRLGKLVFKNASIQHIIERLQHEYGWSIAVNDRELLKRKVNATVQKDKPELLLEALKEIYELDIRRVSENQYEIR